MAVGYTSGNPNKVDRAGDTMTGALTLPADPTADLHAATKKYVDDNAGGGGGGTPADTVTAETSYGQSATAGIATAYSRGDHTHGTPAAPTLSGLGGQQQLVVRRAYVTSGDIQLPNVGSTWTLLGGLSLSIPAQVGDYVELALIMMINPGNSDNFLDAAVVVSGSAVRYASNGTGTPASEGWPALYPSPGGFRTTGAIFSVVAEAGDLDGGNMTFGIASVGPGNSVAGDPKIYASTAYPFAWRAINHGEVLLS